jgi:glycosyltransferase involved in cell wall biosynthesis
MVSVIVPARDAAPTLGRALASLEALELDEPFEVIVVDDGSQDETAQIARDHRWVRLVENPQSMGPGAARNAGARAAQGSVLAFTDADCFPTPRWLARGLAQIAHADLVQGRVEPDPTQPRTPFDRTLAVEDHGGFYQTANLFVRREIFESVGGFTDWVLEQADHRRWTPDRRRRRAMRTPIGEDTLFAWSARRLGARSAFAEEAVVRHAVVPGNLLDDMADRWHWARDMSGLVRLVPELREGAFEYRVFFNETTARFDLALAGLLAAAVTGRKRWLLAGIPYLRHRLREARQWGRTRRAIAHLVGMPVVDATTVAGLLVGSVRWRCVVL